MRARRQDWEHDFHLPHRKPPAADDNEASSSSFTGCRVGFVGLLFIGVALLAFEEEVSGRGGLTFVHLHMPQRICCEPCCIQYPAIACNQ
jgi:hypothetical protein